VLWHEMMLIGVAVLLIAAADNLQSMPSPLSPVLQPANVSPDSTMKESCHNQECMETASEVVAVKF